MVSRWVDERKLEFRGALFPIRFYRAGEREGEREGGREGGEKDAPLRSSNCQ